MPYAVYYEFTRDDGDTYQCLFIPSLRLGRQQLPPLYASRVRAGGRSTWMVVSNTSHLIGASPADDESTQIKHEIQQLEGISSRMREPISNPTWSLTFSSPVDVSESALLALKESPTKVPSVLNEGIKRVRVRYGLNVLEGD